MSSRPSDPAAAAATALHTAAFEHAMVGMAVATPDGVLEDVNEALCSFLGRPREELIGASFADLTHPDDVEETRLRSREVIDGLSDGFRLEKRYRRPDGRDVWGALSGRLLRDEHGEPQWFFTQIADITDRKEAQRALADSEERVRSIIASVHEGICMMDGSGTILEINDSAARIFGVSRDEALGRTKVDAGVVAVDEDGRPLGAEDLPVARALATGLPESGAALRLRQPDGSVRVCYAHTQPLIRPGESRPYAVVSSFTDVTERLAAERALRASEEHHRLVLRNLPGAVIAAYDCELRCTLIEGAWLQETDSRPEEFVGRHVSELASPGSLPALEGAMRRALEGEEHALEHYSQRTGRHLVVQTVPYRDESGAITGVINVSRDVTATREAEQRRRAAEERFEIAFERAPIGIGIVSLEGRILKANAAMTEITGHAREQLEATTIGAITHPDDLAEHAATFDATASGATPAYSLEKRLIHAAGHPVWVSVRSTIIDDEDGRPQYMLSQVQDITERKRYEDRLQHLADHDPLTGLLNRRGFERALQEHLAHCRRYGAAGAVLVLDLDGFKFVNDTLGHNAGDELIVSCAGALRERLRETDVVARLGGDEFAVLLPAEDKDARTVAQAIVDAIRAEAAGLRGQHPGKVTASVGVALFDDPSLTADEMLANADLAMYDAKEAGKDRFAFYRSAEYAVPRIKAQMTWLDRIGRAIEQDRFVLHAQPVVDLAGREAAWHEVLVRMLGDDDELIPPGTFLYIAERYDLAKAVDQWVLTRAIRTMAREKERGRSLSLSVNVSGASAGDPEVLETVARELRAGGLDPGALILEITETAAVADIPRARRFAESLRELGCRFALDDFGAGFGSFYYLKHLPFDLLKIDGEFVKQCLASETDRLVISAVTEIARGLGKQTVAEFVQDDATVELLVKLGVDLGQGYHLGRPRPLEDLLDVALVNPLG